MHSRIATRSSSVRLLAASSAAYDSSTDRSSSSWRVRSGARGDGDGQISQAVQPVVELGNLLATDVDPLDTLEQRRDDDLCLEPGDGVADAEVRPETECELAGRVAGDVEPVRIVPAT